MKNFPAGERGRFRISPRHRWRCGPARGMQSPALMPPGVKTKTMLEQLHAEVSRLRELVEGTPLLHRKDVERLLGVSQSTLTRRLKRRDFPKPTYDAGRPKWRPSQFAGQPVSG